MPNIGTTHAKQKRASSLGNSSKFYKIKTSPVMYVAGGMGFGKKDASIGSMESLGRLKYVR